MAEWSGFLELGANTTLQNGPRCYCGRSDWRIGTDYARCASCDRRRDFTPVGYVVNGPTCYCGASGWFIGTDYARCASCDRKRRLDPAFSNLPHRDFSRIIEFGAPARTHRDAPSSSGLPDPAPGIDILPALHVLRLTTPPPPGGWPTPPPAAAQPILDASNQPVGMYNYGPSGGSAWVLPGQGRNDSANLLVEPYGADGLLVRDPYHNPLGVIGLDGVFVPFGPNDPFQGMP